VDFIHSLIRQGSDLIPDAALVHGFYLGDIDHSSFRQVGLALFENDVAGQFSEFERRGDHQYADGIEFTVVQRIVLNHQARPAVIIPGIFAG